MSRKTNHRVHAALLRMIEDPGEAKATVIRRVLGGKWTMSPEAVRNSAVRKAVDRAAKRARPLAANERASIATVDGAARMLATLEHHGLRFALNLQICRGCARIGLHAFERTGGALGCLDRRLRLVTSTPLGDLGIVGLQPSDDSRNDRCKCRTGFEEVSHGSNAQVTLRLMRPRRRPLFSAKLRHGEALPDVESLHP